MGGADESSSEWIGALYDRHAAGLYRYALMLLADPGAAEDAVHQVFTRLVHGRHDRPDVEANYLRRAVRNECYSMLRVRRRRKQAADSHEILEAMTASDDAPEERLAIQTALLALPAEQREVVHLKIFEGLTLQEIAELTDESINTIASRYRYALVKMRRMLGRE
jgi:RNA polymerase sigma-70 factor (ECF subfamily)